MKISSRRGSSKAASPESPDARRARVEAFILKTREEAIRRHELADDRWADIEVQHSVLAVPMLTKPHVKKARR